MRSSSGSGMHDTGIYRPSTNPRHTLRLTTRDDHLSYCRWLHPGYQAPVLIRHFLFCIYSGLPSRLVYSFQRLKIHAFNVLVYIPSARKYLDYLSIHLSPLSRYRVIPTYFPSSTFLSASSQALRNMHCIHTHNVDCLILMSQSQIAFYAMVLFNSASCSCTLRPGC